MAWFILRQRLGLARRRVLLVALAMVLAGSAFTFGTVGRDGALPVVTAPRTGATDGDCVSAGHAAGVALVPDHSRQLPAPSPAPAPGDTPQCRRVRSLVPREEPKPFIVAAKTAR
jgi:hypothetical protein